jgi:hypothetical protein
MSREAWGLRDGHGLSLTELVVPLAMFALVMVGLVTGWLFKNDLTETERRELVVFLTAKVVASSGQANLTPSAVPATPGLPAAPDLSAPPGPSGQAPMTVPGSVLAAAIPPGAALAAASSGPATPVVVPTPAVTPIAASVSSPAAPPPAPVGPTGDR